MERTLLQLENNKPVEILSINGGQRLIRRLESMGLRVGVKVVKIGHCSGPVIVKIGVTQLAIGRGMAEKVIVQG